MGLKVYVYGVKGVGLWGKGVGLWGKGIRLWGNPLKPYLSQVSRCLFFRERYTFMGLKVYKRL